MKSVSVVSIGAVLLIAIVSSASAQNNTIYEECTTPGGLRASCIPLEECTFLYNMLLSRSLKESDRLFLRQSQCGYYKRRVLVCCIGRNTDPPQPKITTRALLPDPNTYCINTISNRIYGGSAVEFDEFPWTALILYDEGNTVNHHCGGSLINNRYVLTAAHCISLIPTAWKVVSVRLGEWDTSTDRDCKTDRNGLEVCTDRHVDIPIESIITHPNYVSTAKNQLNDIALLRLSHTVSYTDFIQPICLPIRDNLKDISLDGIRMDIAGWGHMETGRSNIKLKATVPGIAFNDCQRLYGQNKLKLENSQMCAGGEMDISTCRGDSGGALVALDASTASEVYYYIAGIISFGPHPCGLKGWPEVFTKVSSYVDWIQQNIRP